MRRELICIASLGILAILLSRSALSLKGVAGGPTTTRLARIGTPASNYVASTPEVAVPISDKIHAADPSPATATFTLAADDPDAEAQWISSLSEAEVSHRLANLAAQDLAGNTATLLMRRWVELDPTVAVTWANQIGDATARQELVDAAATAWSEDNLPAALAWVKSLPEDAAKNQALGDLGFELARTDPASAMQLALQLPAGDTADGLLLHALAQYASQNPEQSRQLALSLPTGTLRDQALALVATVQSQQDGASAATFAVQNIPSGAEFDRAIIGVVQGWEQNSFTGATAWVQSFPDSPLRDQAVLTLGTFEGR